MREYDERRVAGGEVRDDELAARDESPPEATLRVSSQGSLPPVVDALDAVYKPTASDIAYKDDNATYAPPKPATKEKAPATAAATKEGWPQLLEDFGALFPQAAKLIAAYPSSLQFVKECQAKGAKFGGHAESDEADTEAWPYTIKDSVHIPKSHGDGLQAMSDFLFELNNAVREPRFKALRAEARKGSKGSLDAKMYARKVTELEVEGMLKLGELWLETKKEAKKEKDKTWSRHDHHFYLRQYLDFREGKVTKDDIVDAVLHTKYTEGDDAGKTPEEVYMKEYEAHAQFEDKGPPAKLEPLEKP